MKPSEAYTIPIELDLLIAKDAELKNYMMTIDGRNSPQEIDVFTNIPGL